MNGLSNDAELTWTNLARTRLAGAEGTIGQTSSQLARLDSELLAIEIAFQLAKELRNQKAPVNSLPDEILLEIFLYIRDIHESFPPIHWLKKCTHVCHRFRSVALSSHALWTRLNNKRKCPHELLKALAARSGSLPTQFDLHIRESMTKPKALKYALDFELNRAETLSVTNSVRDCPEQLFSWLFGVPAPLLRDLKIDFSPQQSRPWQPPVYVPHALKLLHLSYSAFDWTSKMYDNLVELHLSNLADGPSSPSPEVLQNLFLRMHSITTITLEHICYFDESTPTVKLPESLKYFEIRNSIFLHAESVAFAPPSSLLKATLEAFEDTENAGGNGENTSNAIRHWCTMLNGQAQYFVELSLFANETSTFLVTVYNDSPTPQLSASHSAPPPQSFTYLRFIDEEFEIDVCLAKICESVSGLRLALCRGRDEEFLDSTWHSLFKKLEGLKTLVLTEASISTVLPCLVEAPAYFPQLEVFEVVAGDEDEVELSSELDAIGHIHVVWMSQWIEGRRKQGLQEPRIMKLPPILQGELSQTNDGGQGDSI